MWLWEISPNSFRNTPAQYDLDALVLAVRAFVRPCDVTKDDVTKDEDLSVSEKRRILASWAPDPAWGSVLRQPPKAA
jgi:hypothetical protein